MKKGFSVYAFGNKVRLLYNFFLKGKGMGVYCYHGSRELNDKCC